MVGAGPVIGAAVAGAFAQEDHPVVLIARDRARLERPAHTSRGGGTAITTAPEDVGEASRLTSTLGRLELSVPVGVLVYNAAGFGGRAPASAVGFSP